MSVVDYRGVRVPLDEIPRGADRFWKLLEERYCDGDPRRSKLLAAFVLHESEQWPIELIGRVFGVDKGNISRWLQRVKQDLRIVLEGGTLPPLRISASRRPKFARYRSLPFPDAA
jgi:hypothetical protein